MSRPLARDLLDLTLWSITRMHCLSVFIITSNKDMHVSFSRQKVVKDGIWRVDLIDRHYMVHTV